jgi:hypothetical protein
LKKRRRRELRKFLASTYEHGFCFVVVEFQFVCCHPIFHVVVAVGSASQEWLYVVGFVVVLKLCVVSVEVVVDVMGLDDVGQGRGVECEKNRTQYGPLRNSTGQPDWVGCDAVDDDGLASVGEVGKEPGVCRVSDAKGVLKALEEDGVVDSIKSS